MIIWGDAMKGKELEKELIRAHERWEYLKHHGGSDPFWPDGLNMNLVRNHIIHYRRQLEAMQYFPEIYSKEVPPEVDRNYIARADEIRENAKKALSIYRTDDNFRYLEENKNRIPDKKAIEICIWNVIGYERGLGDAIERDDVIEMRRHERFEYYQEAFKSCREKLEAILAEPKPEKIGQLDIFDFIGG